MGAALGGVKLSMHGAAPILGWSDSSARTAAVGGTIAKMRKIGRIFSRTLKKNFKMCMGSALADF